MNLKHALRQSIQLFKDLPDDIYFSLDLSHFVLPDKAVAKLQSELEKKLKSYVVTYNASVFRLDIPLETHLCALVKGADLNKNQLDLLGRYEKMLIEKGITLVVFQKPLTLIPVEQSAVYKKYKDMKLI